MKKNIYAIIVLLFAVEAKSYSQTWNLIWSDEFTNATIDSTKWVFETGGGGWGNHELENYTNRSDNATISNGNLLIIGKKESYQGSSYTSSRMNTKGKQSFLYGKIEARIKMPIGQGTWPAFWMLGENIGDVGVGWPKCGEIDIMEHIDSDSLNHGTIHWYNNGAVSYGGPIAADLVNQYHIYDVEWDSTVINWYIDGTKYWSANIANSVNNTDAFHKPFFILLNFAIGGDWPGNPDVSTIFPDTMYVDYIRVYSSAKESAFNNIVHPIPGITPAEDYDNGGEGIAYHDDSPGNQGALYRTNENVDIGSNGNGGYSIGWFDKDEWLQYSSKVTTPGLYKVSLSAATTNASTMGHIEINNKIIAGEITITNTGGWTSWQNFVSDTFSLDTGNCIVRLSCDGSSFNVDQLQFSLISTSQTIDLQKGWNIISTNVVPNDSTIATLFNNMDVGEIKTMNAFWRKGQNSILNSLQTITAGQGYLVYMNAAGTLTIKGIQTSASIQSMVNGWQLIGCPFQTSQLFPTLFNTVKEIKDFTGFWINGGSFNSISSLNPGQGYFLYK
jgi:beta-glucanase (GH16 family)